MAKIELNVENAGILSAIWIIASNDENPIITYRSIRNRLGLKSEYPLENLVRSRSELFRLGAPEWRLDEWKEIMRKGGQFPSWFHDHPPEKFPDLINSITPSEVFRSQFRINRAVDKSSVELIEWGLQHIERLRKGSLEHHETRWKWQREVLIPSLSILAAIVAVTASSCLQYVAISSQENQKATELATQERLKKYEVSYTQRSQAYSNLIRAYNDISAKTVEGEVDGLMKALQNMETAFLELRPFLEKGIQATYIAKQSEFTGFVTGIVQRGKRVGLTPEETQRFADYKIFLADTLYEEIFEKSKYTSETVVNPIR